MHLTLNNPCNFQINRSGGAIIVGRVDFWVAAKNSWELKHSINFQDVGSHSETITSNIPDGTYTVVSKFYVEESINGVFHFELIVNGISVGKVDGDVNTTNKPHDSQSFKNQFVITLKG